jgi:DEAD/DEAH box helicase domain-containing protein
MAFNVNQRPHSASWKAGSILFLGLLLLSADLVAADFYVSPTASGSGTGSFSNPWQLQTALNQPSAVHAGDTIWLRGGTYSGIYTGRLVGTVDEPSAHLIVHEGAVYVHQGDSYLVQTLDLADRVALVEAGEPGYTTTAKTATEVEIRGELRTAAWGPAEVRFGDVQVTRQVVSFTQRCADTGALLGEVPLDLPPRHLVTRAVWWTLSEEAADALAGAGVDLGGAAHAAEHASIGLLPLFATCDRWDIGGVSAARHPATGKLTVFVYDGHDGGAGFAERGFQAAADWLRATRQAIAGCDCEHGCPSCVQSPKCGNGNHPLSKRGAVALLDTVLADTGLAAPE